LIAIMLLHDRGSPFRLLRAIKGSNSCKGRPVGECIEREMHQLEQTLMPLLDRVHR
jgi:hypothetical protein